MIRSFIALELEDQETIEKIQSYGTRLKTNQSQLKLVEPQNLHMTVKFLGNIEESLAPKIYKILKGDINDNLFQNKTYDFKLKIQSGQKVFGTEISTGNDARQTMSAVKG